MHILPSVFASTGWVSRRLACTELLRCMDIPQQLDKKILDLYGYKLIEEKWRHIIAAPPGKVLLFCIRSVSLPITNAVESREDLCEFDQNRFHTSTDFKSMIHGDFVTDVSASAGDRNLKAVKSDDAQIPVKLWNNKIVRGISSDEQDEALEVFRNTWVIRWYRRHTYRSFIQYMTKCHGRNWAYRLACARQRNQVTSDLYKDGAVGSDALSRILMATWWTWKAGSTLLFWRWAREARRDARDGSTLPWKIPPFPKYVLPQRYPKNVREKEMVVSKIKDPIAKRYISEGFVESLSTFFHVPKGDQDIRIVYDMTKCGINACLWSPRFYLPTPDAVFDSIEYNSWMGDIDQGEMFLNYFADPGLLKYLGVDVTDVVKGTEHDNGRKRIWMRWNRWAMGLRPSPYATTRMFGIGMESIFGNRRDESNTFAWDYIRLNLPSYANYKPSEPWVSKRTKDHQIPPDAFTFVDDIRVVGRAENICDDATRKVGSSINHLGEQEASRKRRPASQRSGAWIGSIFRADESNIGILTSQEKWDKAKGIIGKWKEFLLDKERLLDRKELERDRGFLVHLSMVYPCLTPYLKGLHLTLETWRPDRDIQGWKLPRNDWARLQMHLSEQGIDADGFGLSYADAPSMIVRAPRLRKDLEDLSVLTKDAEPPLRVVRSKFLKANGVSFVDASGLGKGGSTMSKGRPVSIWFANDPVNSKESSNFRELNNLVENLELEHEKGNLSNLEVFICTDNSVAERDFYKGSSKSEKLFILVLRLRSLQQSGNFKLHVLHVAGTRRIEQGTDGLSRGLPYEGLLGENKRFLDYLPLHLDAFERSPSLRSWLKEWIPNWEKFLKAEDWFELGHDIVGWYKPKAL